MEKQGAFVNKGAVLDALDKMEEEILWQMDTEDTDTTKDNALFGLKVVNGIRASVKNLTTYCVVSGGVSRRSGTK